MIRKKSTGNGIKSLLKNFVSPCVRVLAPYMLGFLLAITIFNTVLMLNFVPSASMEPTISAGSALLSTRYDKNDIERYDIIIFEIDGSDESNYIKRVIGLPGETITIEQGNVYADGVKLDSSYIKEEMNGLSDGVYIVPEDSYFVMGDNRNHSWDSRYTGTVPAKNILAKAKFIFYPLSDFGAIR